MKWVLIDFSFLTHRALHATGELSYEDIPTGVVFGFWEQLLEICSNPSIQSTRIALFGDSKKSYRRKRFPKYKMKRYAQRSEEDMKRIEKMHDQMNVLRNEVFPKVGIPYYQQVGLESDDLIAWTARELTKQKEEGIIITSDGDLFQCVTDFVSWFDPQRNRHMNPEYLLKRKGVRPNQWAKVKAIGGCKSDCVPGIVGVSEKGAIDYLLGKIPKHYKKYEKITSEEGQDTIRFTRSLVTLPHKKTKAFALVEPEYNEEAFFEHVKDFGIESYLVPKKRNRWERFFKGEVRRTAAPRMRKRRNGRYKNYKEKIRKKEKEEKEVKKNKQRYTIRKRSV